MNYLLENIPNNNVRSYLSLFQIAQNNLSNVNKELKQFQSSRKRISSSEKSFDSFQQIKSNSSCPAFVLQTEKISMQTSYLAWHNRIF